jgi:hypothetical protein
MSLDVLRSVAGPMLNSLSSLSRLSQTAEQPAAAAPAQAPRGGLQVLDGFDADTPAVQSTSAAGPTTAAAASTAAQAPQTEQNALAQGGQSKNPLEQLLSVFTDFVKKIFSTFLGGLFGQGQGAGGATPGASEPTPGAGAV